MKSKLKAAVAAAAVTALLAACGGDSSGDNAGNTPGGGGGGGSTTIDPSVSVQSVYDYIASLIATDNENSPPRDVNALTLAVDETSKPVDFTP